MMDIECSPFAFPLPTDGYHTPFVGAEPSLPEMGGVVFHPGPHDVLLGRGGGTNNYCGNIKFRKLVNEHKMRYLTCSKVEKPNVAREVVALWRTLNPPGRFLAKRDKKKKQDPSAPTPPPKPAVWIEVGDKKAREKASQCLRERTPDVLPLLRHMREQQEKAKKVTLGPALAEAAAKAKEKGSSRPGSPDAPEEPAEAVVPEKLQIPDVEVIGTTLPPKVARAKRARAQKERLQARKQARSLSPKKPEALEEDHRVNLSQRNSPTFPTNERCEPGMMPQTERVMTNFNEDGIKIDMPEEPGMTVDPSASVDQRAMLSRRNSIPPECHPHHESFVDRRGSLPTGMGMGSMKHRHHSEDCLPAMDRDMGISGGMQFTPNASAMMQMHGMGTEGVGAGLTGMSMGGAYPSMPGQSPMGASPFLDAAMCDPISPLNSARFKQQRLRLQQLKLEQQQLQQQLDHQIQMEMEMQMVRARQRPSPSFVKQQIAAELLYAQQEEAASLRSRASSLHPPRPPLQHPLHRDSTHGSEATMSGRGVEAPGYLPNSRIRVEDPLVHPCHPVVHAHPAQRPMRQRERRSDPPTQSFENENHAAVPKPSRRQSFGNTPTPEENRAAEPGPAHVTPPSEKLVHQEMPKEMPPHLPRSVQRQCSTEEVASQQRASQPQGDNADSADLHSEMTLAEYRKTLDAFMTSNNIAIHDEHIYSDDEEEDGPRSRAGEDLSVRSFVEWKDNHTGAEESRYADSPRPDPPARDGHGPSPNQRSAAVPHIPRRGLQRQHSAHSAQSARTMRSSFTSLSGMSLLSATSGRSHRPQEDNTHRHNHADDASIRTADGKITKGFSCNESVVSEITMISHTINGLGLEGHE